MTGTTSRLVVWLFASSIFGSAALLFLVQPMFARMVLAPLGGSPAVWTCCMLFFQAVLLLGYLYAHVVTRWLMPRRQVLLHVVMLALPLLTLPMAVPRSEPPASGLPVWWLLGVLATSAGLPFFLVATTAPLLQRWFSLLPHRAARDPYFLYVASNAGSMTGLLGYPVLVEPGLRLAQQSLLWAAGYGIVALSIAACGATLFRLLPHAVDPAGGSAHAALGQTASSWRDRLAWLALAFAPSSLMLGVTAHISMEIASVPLLWIIPLALYLLTFMLTFARRPPIPGAWTARLLPILITASMAALAFRVNSAEAVAIHLLTFFAAAMVCHRELADRRPHVADLTTFYLWVATGGALGGLFNTLVAPALFTTIAEFPLALAVVALLRPSPRWWPWTREPRVLIAGVPVAAGAIVLAAWGAGVVRGGFPAVATVFLLALLAAFAFVNRVRPLAVVIALLLVIDMGLPSIGRNRVVHGARSFFGVHQVIQDMPPTAHFLRHGNTMHGRQQLAERDRCVPTTYFHRSGPIGQVFRELGDRARSVAVIGLGTGSLACYAVAGSRWTFYEIDPEVERIARDGRYFTFLENSPVDVDVVLGDGRRGLVHASGQRYDVIVMDAFGSDAIPIHLVTEEFVGLAFDRMQPGGVLAFNITNRHIDLEPVLGAIAGRLGLESRTQRDNYATLAERRAGKSSSDWLILTRDLSGLGGLMTDARWRPTRAGPSAWTDDFANILDVIVW
jgi:hypothetical protein